MPSAGAATVAGRAGPAGRWASSTGPTGCRCGSAPTVDVGADQVELRLALIEEEVGELAEAARAGDLVGVADALADIVYVAYGTAHVYGIDLDAVLDEVHASNMTKLGADGRPIRRADGKVLKGPDYRPPDIAAVLEDRCEGLPSMAGICGDLPAAGDQRVPSVDRKKDCDGRKDLRLGQAPDP